MDFLLEFQIRNKDKTLSVTDAVEWLLKHTSRFENIQPRPYTKRERLMVKVIVTPAQTVVIKKEVPPYKCMNLPKGIVDYIDGKCICDIDNLMKKGCTCGGQ